MQYFAYGSNMLTRRLTARVSSSEALGKAFLPAYQLLWHKAGRDGSAKCGTATGQSPANGVWGVAFTIRSEQKHLLDRAEDLGKGYRQQEVTIQLDGQKVSAFTYVALKTDPDRIPFHWYKQLVVQGAIEHGLPEQYLFQLKQQPSRPDPNEKRKAKNHR